MKTNTFLLIIFFALTIASCKKNVSCDASLCVKNIGHDTIHYSWGSSAYTDSLLPGQSGCTAAGHIEVSGGSSSTPTLYFESDHGNYAITVDECEETREVE
jgi:hypothetical protein